MKVPGKDTGNQMTIEKEYTFDGILNEKISQQETFNIIGEPLCDRVLDGYTTCIMAYGQTGSGKTFTMV